MIHHTTNETTTKVGQAVATVIADSINDRSRITTLELVYPRYIHSELLTHRMLSRNASSSRATPLKVMLGEVRHDPVFFDYVGKDKAGMVAGEQLTEEELCAFQKEWNGLARVIATAVENIHSKYKIHKQTLNRLLEPFSRIRTLVTATEWDNFFKLRLAPDAQPEMQSLAIAMRDAMSKSEPKERDFHVPYIYKETYTEDDLYVSVARCARVSYARLDGRNDSRDEDIALAERLLENGHKSPFEHVAVSVFGWTDNFFGWRSLRNFLEFKQGVSNFLEV